MENTATLVASMQGFVVAIAIGFLIGRNLVDPKHVHAGKPGIRDCLLLSLFGGAAALLSQPLLTFGLLLASAAIFIAARRANPQPRGMTSELAALGAFTLGYLSLTGRLATAAALGIVIAAILAWKEDLHRFARGVISNEEYSDTLKFLALIFIIYPLLPAGAYGPYQFFDPRKIWFFIILVSAVSYFGYFFARFLSEGQGRLITAVLGGLASTTAYTGAASKMVVESPALATTMVRPTLVANAIMFPRMAVLLAVLDGGLARQALPVLGLMTVVGLLAAWWLGRSGERPTLAHAPDFRNPFALRPALKFGILFALVLFITKVGHAFLGDGGWPWTSLLGGFMDVDAVLLSLGESHDRGHMAASSVTFGIILAGAANAVFKSILAVASRQPAFYLRLIAGFVLIFSAGFALAWVG
jgi:uncharacterized membrane protein (DUF4010 family)